MPKYKSIPHEVTAVQWKGEVTPELKSLFGPGTEITMKPSGDPRIGVPSRTIRVERELADRLVYADIGDWIVRCDYREEHGGGFDLDVMEPDDFSNTYEPDNAPPGGIEFNIVVPAVLTGAGREAPSDIRVRLAIGHASPDILGSIAAQLLPHIRNQSMAVGCVHALCAELDPDTLVTIRDAIERIMVAKLTHH